MQSLRNYKENMLLDNFGGFQHSQLINKNSILSGTEKLNETDLRVSFVSVKKAEVIIIDTSQLEYICATNFGC